VRTKLRIWLIDQVVEENSESRKATLRVNDHSVSYSSA